MSSIRKGRGVNKHYWTSAQDAALVDSLLELSQNTMWKADSGFKNGYLNQLEGMMKTKLQDCNLKASPHIESRVKWLKQKYCILSDMLSLSGFGWDNEKMMTSCERSVFEEYVKHKKDAAGLFQKSFPHYFTLGEIYGRDRATGTNAGNADDDEEDIRLEDNTNVNLGDDLIKELSEESFNHMFYTEQPTPPHHMSGDGTPSTSTNKSKKRKSKEKSFDHMCSNIGSMAESVAAMVPKLDGLINVLSTADKDVADLQAKLYEEMMKIEGLDDDQIYDATNILATKHDLLRVFFTMPDQLKKGYILKMLHRGV